MKKRAAKRGLTNCCAVKKRPIKTKNVARRLFNPDTADQAFLVL
jgi:hypothetical protein